MKFLLLSCAFAILLPAVCFAATFDSLGQPCRGFNVLASRVVIDPAGKEWFVLSNTNETSGVELIFIDFKTNEGKVFKAPAGSGAWALNAIPGDRLVVGTYYDGKMMVFDLKTMQFTKVIPFPGEEYFWNAAIGSDGRLYGGTYPGGKLGALDLNTLTMEDCGAPAAPNLYCRNVSATPDGRILCNFVTSKPVTKLFDPRATDKTKQWSDVPEQMKNVQRATIWNGYLLSGSQWDGGDTSGAIAFKGNDFQPVDPPPFPIPSADKGKWAVDLFLTTTDTLYLRQGTAIWRLNKGEKELTKVFQQDLKSGAITAAASDGTLLGIRGQDYIICRPGESAAKLIPIPVQSGPRPMHFIRPDDSGKLWGGPQFGQTMFYVDLATKQSTNTGIVCNAGGEVYDVAFKDGKVYAVSYVGGDVVEYDPNQPWDQLGGKNPRTIAHLTSKGYIRPVGGVQVGSDGKLYSGWMASYGKYGGAIAITDPKTSDTKLIQNPLGEQPINGLAVDDQFIYAATSLHGNGLPIKPNEQAQLGILERDSGKVVFQQPLAGEVAKLLLDAKTQRLVLLSGGRLLQFDLQSRKFIDPPAGLPSVNEIAVDGIGDGRIWFGSDKSVIRLDLATGELKKFDAPAKVDRLGVGKNGRLFIASGPDAYGMTEKMPEESK